MCTRPAHYKGCAMEMRVPGVFRIDVSCSDYRCNHSTRLSADRRTDYVRLSDIEPQYVCKACGKRGADDRPDFQHATMGTGRWQHGSMMIARI